MVTIELSGRRLFAGTDTGSIIQYELTDRKSSADETASIRRVKELGPVSPETDFVKQKLMLSSTSITQIIME